MLTTTLQFSTRRLPPAQRLCRWYHVFDRSVSRRELSPSSDGPFDMHATVSRLGGTDENDAVCVQRMTFTSGFSARRTQQLLADGNDDIILYVQNKGGRVVSQCRREVTVEAGRGVLCSNADPSIVTVPGPSRFVCIALPRKPLAALVPNLADLLARPLPGDGLQLLESYLSILGHCELVNTARLRQAVVTHIYDLVAVALGALHDAIEIANDRGIRAARMHAIKADIARNLASGDVSAGALAARHRVTRRYVHKLFQGEGSTLSKFVLGQRLARVHRMLSDVRSAGQTVGSLAFATGFNDLSNFNHAFRRHYGETPSDVRAAACASHLRELALHDRSGKIAA